MRRVASRSGAVLATLLFAGAGAAAAAPSPPRARLPAAKAPRQLVSLSRPKAVFSDPSGASRRVGIVSDVRPLTGEQTVLPVIGHATDGRGAAWLDVLLPGRPNGHTGWISTGSTVRAITTWRLTISISTRRVTVLRGGRFQHMFSVVVGAPSTPTPVGSFFVEESVLLGDKDRGAPYALALSARSNVLQEFDGGPGQIALHGTNNLGGVLGTAASHGCIRLSTQAITWLAARIEPGTPVSITR